MTRPRNLNWYRGCESAVILLVWSWLDAQSASAVERIYNILTDQSNIAISGNLVTPAGTAQLQQQGPGSLSTSYAGTIHADRGAGSIQFLTGGTIDADISGNWQPMPGGSMGSAPADYGGTASLLAFTATLAARNLTADLSSNVVALGSEGKFALSTTSLNLTGGSIDYRAFTALGTQSIVGLSSMGSGTGSLAIAPHEETLSIPINASYSLVIGLGVNGNATVNLTFTGQLTAVANITLPGDFNHDGTVDAVDYVVWRKNPVGIYTPNDFNVWRANFGRTAGSSADAIGSARVNVPEPTGGLLFSVGIVMFAVNRMSAK